MIIGFHANWLVFPNMVTCTYVAHALEPFSSYVCALPICVYVPAHVSKGMRSVLVSVWDIYINVCVCMCAPQISGKLGSNLPKIIAVNF